MPLKPTTSDPEKKANPSAVCRETARSEASRTERDCLDNPIRALVRVFGLFDRLMRPYFDQFGITGSQFGILITLAKAEWEGLDQLRLTDLAERLLIRPPSVTSAVARLERDGLLHRDASTTDLRAKQIRLSAQGRELVERIMHCHPAQVEFVLSALNASEQGDLLKLLTKLGDHLESQLAKPAKKKRPRASKARPA